MHRAPARGMAKKADARAERIRARKERREQRSVATLAMELGLLGPVTFSLNTATIAPAAVPADDTEDCPDCIRRRNRTAARLALRRAPS